MDTSSSCLHSLLVSCNLQVWPTYAAWFANYMVVKRAAQEANYHVLYIQMCDKMNEKDLTKQLIKITHYYVRILLYRSVPALAIQTRVMQRLPWFSSDIDVM